MFWGSLFTLRFLFSIRVCHASSFLSLYLTLLYFFLLIFMLRWGNLCLLSLKRHADLSNFSAFVIGVLFIASSDSLKFYSFWIITGFRLMNLQLIFIKNHIQSRGHLHPFPCCYPLWWELGSVSFYVFLLLDGVCFYKKTCHLWSAIGSITP